MDADRHLYRTFACTACGHTIKAPVSCGNRFCPVCSGPRRRRASAKLRLLASQISPPFGYTFKHLTLTIRSSQDLSRMHRNLVSGFRCLRQSALWRSKVRGGAYTLELTGRPGAWHLHLHAILEARYIPWSLLHSRWLKVSKSHGVFIATRPRKLVIHYLTKYLTKNELSPDILKSAGFDLRSARLFNTFGSWHSVSIKLPNASYPCPKCGQISWFPLDLLDIINKIGYLPRKRKHERAPSSNY